MSLKLSQILDGLNEAQKEAVTATEGPVCIVAGPGTGKTLTIVRRIAYLINQGIDPENILAVTFTNRAAREMRERAGSLLGRYASTVFIGTLHLLGLKIISENSPARFMIYNRKEQHALLKKALKDSGSKMPRQKGRKLSVEKVSECISNIKNLLLSPDDDIQGVYHAYQDLLSKNNALDFDDLILKPMEILNESGISERYANTFRYVMVDEYQDINPAQYAFLKLLTGMRSGICVIGDSDQAIYAFRGADVRNFMRFGSDFQDARTIILTDNYRSTGAIVGSSQSLIINNLERIDKELNTIREKGVPVNIVSVPDDKAEGEFIINEIEKRMGGTSHYRMLTALKDEPGYSCSFSDFAVMYRTHAQAKAIEEYFIGAGIPHRITGARYFSKKEGMTNIFSILKCVVDPADNGGYETVIPFPADFDIHLIGKLRKLKDTQPIEDFLRKMWEEPVFRKYCSEESLMFIEELAVQYRSMETSAALERFVDELSVLTPADDFDSKVDAVSLMTLHMAKGLEFKVVFITGVEEGMIPFTFRKDMIDPEEERRLFYVGMTRAVDELFLLHARTRFIYGQQLTRSPSPFIEEIKEEFVEFRLVPDRMKKQKKDEQMGLF